MLIPDTRKLCSPEADDTPEGKTHPFTGPPAPRLDAFALRFPLIHICRSVGLVVIRGLVNNLLTCGSVGVSSTLSLFSRLSLPVMSSLSVCVCLCFFVHGVALALTHSVGLM